MIDERAAPAHETTLPLATLAAAERALTEAHPSLAEDIRRGVAAAARVYVGEPDEFASLCVMYYAPTGDQRVELARALDGYLADLTGNLTKTLKQLRHGLDVDTGPLRPVDQLFASFSPAAHVQEDLRASNIAAVVQLNFGGVPDAPDAEDRSADEWLALALARVGTEAVPHGLIREHSRLTTRAEELVQSYNLFPGSYQFDTGVTFPDDLRLISHWGLRDYMTGLSGTTESLARQRAILGLLEAVVRGEVPMGVVDDPTARWDIPAATVRRNGHSEPATPEGSRRWEPFQAIFQVQRQIDRYSRRPTLLDTMFLEERKMTEERVEAMLVELLSTPLMERIAVFVEGRLGRALEPFDIYFKRFQAEDLDTAHLDALTRQRYPDRAALQAALPDVLAILGFARNEAAGIASHIRVDASRSAGHAWPPATPDDLQLLRVRVDPDGISWQDFGVYMHELGHCVEGVLSSYAMPYRLLWGVPATAFSEAFAFTFQDLASTVLGVDVPRDRDVEAIQRVWEAFEIAGPALVEMRLFRWLYAHPEASAQAIHDQVQRLADELWADYCVPVFGPDGHGLLGVYSHMLWGALYLAEYPLGYIIAHQVRRHLAGKDLALEMTRLCRLGDIYPDAWMMAAVGAPVSLAPMLEDAAAALDHLGL